MVNVYFSLYLCGDRPKNEKQKNNGKESIKSVCILNKRHKNKKKVVEEVDFTNKEVEEDDKEEEGAERARQMQHFSSVLFRFVIRRRRGKTAFGFLHSLSLSLAHILLVALSFAVSGGRR